MQDVAFQRCIDPRCGRTYGALEALTACPDCGNLLDVEYDWDRLNAPVSMQFFNGRRGDYQNIFNHSGVWRFRELLPFVGVQDYYVFSRQIVCLDGAEGDTRPYHISKAAKYILGKAGFENGRLRYADDADLARVERTFANDRFYIQFEGQNPSGSFKDNGMTAAFTHANMVGAKRAACASTGNTSSSLAAYAMNSNIMDAVIFIGEGKIAYGKLSQGLEYAAKTIQIRGDFDDAQKRVLEVADKLKIYVVNSVNPFRLEGQKTIMYRVLEGLNWQTPDWVIVPGGNLGNNSAFGMAFLELAMLGLIKRIPRFAVIVSEGANTLYRLVNEEGLTWNDGHVDDPVINRFYEEMDREGRRARTVASAIEINRPVNLKKCLRTLSVTNGVVEQVSDEEILDAKAVIGTNGMFGCEPASAATVAGARKLMQAGVISPEEVVVCIATGHQLKDPDAIVGYHAKGFDQRLEEKMAHFHVKDRRFANVPIVVDNEMDRIVEAIES
jgi:threonine synthase